MKKKVVSLMVALLVMAALLTACAGGAANQAGGAGTPAAGSGATGGSTTGDNTAPTLAATEAGTGAGGTGGVDAACAGVDTQQLITTGQQVYTDQCAGCHGEQGAGQGNFPALAGNATVTGADVATIVQKYLSVEGHPKDVTADNLAAALSYVRSSFGNTAAAVCPADIQIPAGN